MNPKFLAGRRENPWTVLALFGRIPNGGATRQLFEIARSIIERVGVEMNVMSVHTSKRRQKYYQRRSPKLLKLFNRDDVIGFSAAHVPSADTDAATLGSVLVHSSDHDFVVTARADLLIPTSAALIPIAKEVAEACLIRYGYSYVIDKYYGPFFHAVGMFFRHAFRKDLPPLEGTERKRTGDWSRASDEVKISGVLRDVFPLNFLSEVHRRVIIEGVPLFDWISQDESRGRLEQIIPTLWAWQVPEDKCIEFGDLFESAGLLVPPPPPASPEDVRKLEELLESGKLVGPGTLVKRPGDKDWVDAQSPRGRARIDGGIKRAKGSKGSEEKKKEE
jgi:hypothetical protein